MIGMKLAQNWPLADRRMWSEGCERRASSSATRCPNEAGQQSYSRSKLYNHLSLITPLNGNGGIPAQAGSGRQNLTMKILRFARYSNHMQICNNLFPKRAANVHRSAKSFQWNNKIPISQISLSTGGGGTHNRAFALSPPQPNN